MKPNIFKILVIFFIGVSPLSTLFAAQPAAQATGHNQSGTNIAKTNVPDIVLYCMMGNIPALQREMSSNTTITPNTKFEHEIQFFEGYKSKNYTLIHIAAVSGQVETLTYLLSDTTIDIDVNAQDSFNETPLIYAAIAGKHHCIRELLKHANIKPNLSNIHLCTALHLAAKSNKTECLIALLIDKRVNINAENKYKATPLLVAANNGSLDCLVELIKYGADITKRNESNFTALHMACRQGSPSCVIELLKDPNLDVHSQEKNAQNTPLHLAAENNKKECLIALINDKRVNIDVENKYKATPLFVAAQNGSLECLIELIKYGADINKVQKDTLTPLHVACTNAHLSCVTELLKCPKIKVNALAERGLTSLCIAARARLVPKKNVYQTICLELLKHGANPSLSCTDDKGVKLSAYNFALKGGNTLLSNFLYAVEHGAFDTVTITTPPTHTSSSSAASADSTDSCCVCSETFAEHTPCIVLWCNKNHIFHELCIKEWLTTSSNENNNFRGTCPLCREPAISFMLKIYDPKNTFFKTLKQKLQYARRAQDGSIIDYDLQGGEIEEDQEEKAVASSQNQPIQQQVHVVDDMQVDGADEEPAPQRGQKRKAKAIVIDSDSDDVSNEELVYKNKKLKS